MNRYTAATLLACIAAVSAGQAMAETPTIDPTPFVSTKSRADVKNELAEFKKSGVNPWASSYDPIKYFSSTKSREQVTAEFMGNRDQVAASTAEDSGSSHMAQRRVQPAGGSMDVASR
ncbi:DUF4148 domain-containing protein [Ramlibacter henchirensis]|uniref:DUF4148 domain-containing protein n=1 Tax=Ramlibacter henchirensis TaxID=204072 RepID=A0A4Z0C756_9BURK|nr:DUF4148 domain-containing protein [Ramlibacter henchirensis]TFZ05929.1 DUF4148 domain-containing protein [Ramlibacter henchirensis]